MNVNLYDSLWILVFNHNKTYNYCVKLLLD